jgi:hypothetical protein
MIDLFQRANWSEIYFFFARGNPPLAVVLLALNTVFFIYWIVRRMRGARAMRSETAIIVQALLLGSNLVIMFKDDFERATNIGYYIETIIARLPI